LKKILFVCSGNTCRSPLAEGIARKAFPKPFADNVSSAGSSAVDGMPASSLSVEVARKHSIDLSGHEARLLSGTLVREADLIVAMASGHRETVGIIEPAALAYTHLLTDFCDDADGDIVDPIGMGPEVYEETFKLIEKCIKAMSGQIEDFKGWRKRDRDN
jgi:protein-tyrosine-phosphatase